MLRPRTLFVSASRATTPRASSLLPSLHRHFVSDTPDRVEALQPATTTHTCRLDHQTLYVDQKVAESLGWKPSHDVKGIPLTLHGWAPGYFVIAPTGTDAERLASATIESSRNKNVQQVLDHLKDN